MILNTYSLDQWIVFFFIYCFIGWIWETGYVSFKQKEFVNRGFMHGPFLPIYGSGAIVVLISTLPVRENAVLVFLLGMIGATILEYVTGVAMEQIFGVRYWDYSKEPLNVKGHICIVSSLAWGCFSVLMVYVLHRPFENLVLKLPAQLLDIGATVLSVYMAVDMTLSFREAMDLKEILTKLTESNEEIRRIKNRLDSMVLNIKNHNKELGLHNLDKFMSENKRKYDNLMHEQIECINELKRTGIKQLENNIEIQREKSGILLKHFSDSLSGLLRIVEDKETESSETESRETESTGTESRETESTGTESRETESTGTESTGTESTGTKSTGTDSKATNAAYLSIQREVAECSVCIHEQESRLDFQKNRTYRKALRLLKRYPSTVSSKYADTLGEVKRKHSRKSI